MASSDKGNKTNDSWDQIFFDNPKLSVDLTEGKCTEITADLIKKYREPRLMAKFDTREALPQALAKRRLGILPLSTKSYMLGPFDLYKDFPDSGPVSDATPMMLPPFETLTVDNLGSESLAINAMTLAGILDDFLKANGTVETFNGRMRSGDFDFSIDSIGGGKQLIPVRGAQIEIDGGFENDESVVILEAKNVKHENFLVRQLYYPFRRYREIVKKPIRLVFSQYTNMEYRLFEYRFEDPYNYSSVELLQRRSYLLQDSSISMREVDNLADVPQSQFRKFDHEKVPFPQANDFEKVISVAEFIDSSPENVTRFEVADFLGYAERQANYYPAAGCFIGLIDCSERGTYTLTAEGKRILSLGRKERILSFIRLMFQQEVINETFRTARATGTVPSDSSTAEYMSTLNLNITGTTLKRRASTINSWVRWIFAQTDTHSAAQLDLCQL